MQKCGASPNRFPKQAKRLYIVQQQRQQKHLTHFILARNDDLDLTNTNNNSSNRARQSPVNIKARPQGSQLLSAWILGFNQFSRILIAIFILFFPHSIYAKILPLNAYVRYLIESIVSNLIHIWYQMISQSLMLSTKLVK